MFCIVKLRISFAKALTKIMKEFWMAKKSIMSPYKLEKQARENAFGQSNEVSKTLSRHLSVLVCFCISFG